MRRRALGPKRVALLCALVLFLAFPQSARPAAASPRASGSIVAREVSDSAPTHGSGTLSRPAAVSAAGTPDGAAAAGATGVATLLFTSDVIAAGQLFDRVGVHWVAARGSEGSLFVELRASADGRAWTEWTELSEEEDMANVDANEHFAAPLAVDAGSRYAQYRAWLTAGDPDALVRVGITFIDVDDLNAGPVARLLGDLGGALRDLTAGSAAEAAAGPSKILTRQDWSADESLMTWTPQYLKPHTKAIVHHTVTDDGGTNVAATIRGVYYYHAVTRGWGDIGYNYLVDKFGNIWTGRQGGDNTVGGHAYGWNNGAFGVAAIGDYSVSPPTGALQGAIANIIALKFAQSGIQPLGNDLFTHEEQRADGTWIDVIGTPPNVQGHRDASYIVGQNGGQTACPGGGIYTMLPGLRTLAQNAVAQGYAQLARIEPALPRGTYPGATITVPVTITNRGVTTIPAGTQVSYKLLQKGIVTLPQGAAATLPAPVAPGASATVNLPFLGPALGGYLVRFDLLSSGLWWNLLYGTPYREVWLRSADWSASWLDDNVPASFTAGETRQVNATISNDGGRTWNASGLDPVVITYAWTSLATGAKTAGVNKQPLPYDIAPGQQLTVPIPIVAPSSPNNYTLTLDLEKTNEFHFADRGVAVDDTSIAVLVDFRAGYRATAPTAAVQAGATFTVPATITNAGRGTFPTMSAAYVDLGYHWYDATGKSVLYDGARTKLPADLAAGASVTVQAAVVAPPVGGALTLKLDLVQEGVAWFSTKGVPTGDVPVNVIAKIYAATYLPGVSALAFVGAQTAVPITVTNAGNFTWASGGANPVDLGYHWSLSDGSTAVWDGQRARLPADLPPGGSITLAAPIAFPATPGSYVLRWDMVEEGVSWFSGKGVPTFNQPVAVDVPKPFSYGSSMLPSAPASLPIRMTASVPLRIQNLSTSDWDSSVNLSYHWIDAAGNVAVWDGARTSLAGVRPNEVRDIVAAVAGPPAAGAYTLRWDIVKEGVAWFSGQGVQMPSSAVQATVPVYGALYSVGSVSIAGAAGTSVTVPVTIANTGSVIWDTGTKFALAYHIANAGGYVVWNGTRTALAGPLVPGGTATLNAQVALPAAAGTYALRFDLVQEGVTWFSDQGVPTGQATLVAR